ncbi:glutamate-cysteine ligase family protein [Christiangramia forsetii]|uniref:GCS2 glutamate--cysteine ligase n=2 Tax=Christiangramia forsetii TaxID=411153 RepID=A0M1L9_CHRFK|nr:glutamate-cysteine ligase family protein [Christiangramia forsetii]GGG42219.1 glutamate--cysteine ligase [Christiangramia forsetii]CAL66514.1 GCS2 glutamate--cysteine ligase [Christiangramia forsetii KT0803]
MAYHLFEVFGIELEYMLVKRSNFKVNPIVDQLFIEKHGSITSDTENGKIEWSNELVAHVVEMKTNGPTNDLLDLDSLFAENVREMNKHLQKFDTFLLPSASHPLMNPQTETKLWEHHYNKIYSLYNKIFNCKGHGWSNVQSMHINLPFFDDAEFEKLHAAVRILLPIIPGLSASSPVLDGKFTGFKDSRMEFYKSNQKEIPHMTGKIIPEQVFNKADYNKTIFEPIINAIKPFDTENILDHHFLNSRGAISRFDRNAIEIRVIDIQENPSADIAIAAFIVEVLKLFVSEELVSLEDQKSWHEDDLFLILDEVIGSAETTLITDKKYLAIFDLQREADVKKIWKILYARVGSKLSENHQKRIEFILQHGSLSTRILKAIRNDFSKEHIKKVYFRLAECLNENRMFRP